MNSYKINVHKLGHSWLIRTVIILTFPIVVPVSGLYGAIGAMIFTGKSAVVRFKDPLKESTDD